MAERSKLPKGPSNSAGMGAIPGTQQTAINNVRAAGLNPNMPFEPQLQRQQASSFQRSLTPAAPQPAQGPAMPVPRPAPRRAPTGRAVQQRPVVSQALPLDPGRGYNIFSGMDAGQISGMNQAMGLSNMTSLPSPTPVSDAGAGFGLKQPGRPQSMMLMSGEEEPGELAYKFSDETLPSTEKAMQEALKESQQAQKEQEELEEGAGSPTALDVPESYGTDDKGNQTYTDENGTVWTWYEESGVWGKTEQDGLMTGGVFGVDEGEVPEEALAMKYQDMQGGVPDVSEMSGDEIMQYGYQQSLYEDIGFDPEKVAALKEELGDQYDSVIDELDDELEDQKQELDAQYEEAKTNIDQQYAYYVDDMLADLDRQAAMMGTFGSGAHSANINDVIASSLASMADDYAAIDVQYAQDIKQLGSQYSSALQQLGGQEAAGLQTIGLADLGAEEVDYQQNFANALTAAGYDDNQVSQALQNAAVIDQNLISSVSGLIESSLGGTDSATELYEMLGKATTGLYLSAYDNPEEQAWAIQQVEAVIDLIGVMAKMEAGQVTPEQAQSLWEKIAGDLMDSANPFADDTNIFTDWLVSALPGTGAITSAANLAVDVWDAVMDWFG